jgi:hypothetical protein
MTRTRYTRKMLMRAIASAQGQGLVSIRNGEGGMTYFKRGFVVVAKWPDGALMRADDHLEASQVSEMTPREASRALGLDAA